MWCSASRLSSCAASKLRARPKTTCAPCEKTTSHLDMVQVRARVRVRARKVRVRVRIGVRVRLELGPGLGSQAARALGGQVGGEEAEEPGVWVRPKGWGRV